MTPVDLAKLPRLVNLLETTWTNNPNVTARRDALIVGALLLGLRTHDVIHLRPSNLNPDTNTLRVHRSKRGATNALTISNNWIPCSLEVHAEYQLIAKCQQLDPIPWLFSTLNGTKLQETQIRRASHHFTKRVYGRVYSPHCLRHTAAVLCWEQTKDLRAVQYLLGHKNLRSTEAYLKTIMPPSFKDAFTWSRDHTLVHLYSPPTPDTEKSA